MPLRPTSPDVVYSPSTRTSSHWNKFIDDARKFLVGRGRYPTVVALCEAYNIPHNEWPSIRRRILQQGTRPEPIRCPTAWMTRSGPPPVDGNPRVSPSDPSTHMVNVFEDAKELFARFRPEDTDPVSSGTHSTEEDYSPPSDLCPEDANGDGAPPVTEPEQAPDSDTDIDELQSLRTDFETRVEALEELRVRLTNDLHQIDAEEDRHKSELLRIRAEMEMAIDEENERHRAEIARLRALLN